MSFTYYQRRRSQGPQNQTPEPSATSGPGLDALMNGTARPTAAQKGRSIDLDGAIKAKMEHAFGDLSAVKLYESRAVGAAGAEAIAQGNEIAFAPGMADFSTRTGQERLGHELSHVMSQRSGQVRGQGFLANSALETRADREGALAAAGGQVYTGPVTHALSDASPSPAVAGPMQATRDEDKWREHGRASKHKIDESLDLPEDDPAQFQMRPWHISEKQLERNKFNPTNNKTLAMYQAQIDAAESPRDAYNLFSSFVGSGTGRLQHKDGTPWNPTNVDPDMFKAKLKNMLRVVHDYPELSGKIGNMAEDNEFLTGMSTTSTYGGRYKATIGYNSSNDKMGFFSSIRRFIRNKVNRKTGHLSAEGEYDGTHELGHVLNSLLLDPDDPNAAQRDWDNNETANELVNAALLGGEKNPVTHEKLLNDPYSLARHRGNDEENGILAGQIDLKKSKLHEKGMTSGYGETNASEFFAEAFADVYAHGNKAKPASIALVKEYEKRRGKQRPQRANGHQLNVGSMDANRRAYRGDAEYQHIIDLMLKYNSIDEKVSAQAKNEAEIALSNAAMDYIEKNSGGEKVRNKGRTAKLENMLYQLNMRGNVVQRANENVETLKGASQKSDASQELKTGAEQTFEHLKGVYSDPNSAYSPTMKMITAGVLADQNASGASEPEYYPSESQSAADVLFQNGSKGYGDKHNYLIQSRTGTDVNDSAGTTLHELTHVATGEVYQNSSGMIAIDKNASDQEVLDKYKRRVKTIEGISDALQTNKHKVRGVAGNKPNKVFTTSFFANDKLQYAARNTTTSTVKRQEVNHYRAFMNPILRAEAEEKNKLFNPAQISDSTINTALQPYFDRNDPATQNYLRGQGPKPAGMSEKINLTDDQKQTFKTNMELTQKLKDYDDLIDRNKDQNQDTINSVRKIQTGGVDQLKDLRKTGANVLTEYDTVMNQMLLQYENAGQRNNTPDRDSLFYRRLRNAALRAHLERRASKLRSGRA